MNNKKSIPYLIIIIILLAISSAISIGYIIGISTVQTNQQQKPAPILNNNGNKVSTKIAKIKPNNNSKIKEKAITYKELEIEKARVQELLFELEKAKGDANLLLKYKTQYQNLEAKMRFMLNEIAVLKSNKTRTATNVITTKPKIVNPKPVATKYIYLTPKKEKNLSKTEPLAVKNQTISDEVPVNKIDKQVPELSITNLETAAYKIKSSTRNETTRLASKVDFIKISFTITGNSNAKTDEKKYYIQVINSKNNVLGTKTTEYLDGKTLTYSTLKTIRYEGQNIPIVYELTDNKFEKGNYFISIYDRSKLMAKTNFTLE